MYSLHRCTCGRRGMIWVSRTKFIIKFPSIDRQSLFSDTAGSQARSFLKQLRRFLLFLFSSLDSWKSWKETKPRICRLAFHKSRKDEVAKSIDTDLSACFLLYTTAITKHRFSAFSINHKDLKNRKSYVKNTQVFHWLISADIRQAVSEDVTVKYFLIDQRIVSRECKNIFWSSIFLYYIKATVKYKNISSVLSNIAKYSENMEEFQSIRSILMNVFKLSVFCGSNYSFLVWNLISGKILHCLKY